MMPQLLSFSFAMHASDTVLCNIHVSFAMSLPFFASNENVCSTIAATGQNGAFRASITLFCSGAITGLKERFGPT